jgi:hypothetical protein
VAKEAVEKKEEKLSILEQIQVIQETLKKNRKDFLNTTDKEKSYIESLERSIEEKAELEKSFLIKKDQLTAVENEIAFKTAFLKRSLSDLDDTRKETEKLRIEQINTSNSLIERERMIKEKEKYLLASQVALDKRSDELDLKDERLNEWSIELKEKELNI